MSRQHLFHLPGMQCGRCVSSVARAVIELDPHARIAPELARRQVRVLSGLGREELAEALAEAGYPPAPEIQSA